MPGPATLASLGDIMQLAYVPSDFDAALKHWTEVIGAGPFFLLPNMSLPGGRYRGEASDPAGAVIDPTTLARAASLGLDPARSLADNDSTGFFEALGDLLQPGPTLTNVNDCRVILIEP